MHSSIDTTGARIKNGRSRTIVIFDEDIAICQVQEIGGASRHLADPITVLVFCIATCIIKPYSRTIARGFATGVGDGSINENHAPHLKNSYQQSHENRQSDRELNDGLCAKSGQLNLSMKFLDKHQFLIPKNPLKLEKAKTDQIVGRFRNC